MNYVDSIMQKIVTSRSWCMNESIASLGLWVLFYWHLTDRADSLIAGQLKTGNLLSLTMF
jgi:hypothetical protein